MISQKGFTLLETIVAIGIIAITISSILSLMNNGTRLAREGTNKVAAANLAQEGIELLKNLREEAYNENADTGSTDWDDFLKASTCEQVSNHCRIDYRTNSLSPGTEANAKLFIENNRFRHDPVSAPEASRYSRIVTIEDSFAGSACDISSVAVGDCVIIRSYVWWGDGAPADSTDCDNKCVVLENALFNWNKQT